MKTLLFTLLISATVLAQEGFKAEGPGIVWERTFKTNNADIVSILDKQPNLKINSFIDNAYKGSGFDITNTCKGGSGLMNNNCKFDFIIMVNPDFYVVKVRNLKILEKYGPMQARTIANPCEKYYMSENALRTDERANSDLSCLDSFLSGVFSINLVMQGEALTSNK